MGSILNFIFLSDTLVTNGNGTFGNQGPFFTYLQSKNLRYSLNGKVEENCKNILPIEISKGGMGVKEIPDEVFNLVNNNDVKLLIINLPDPTTRSAYIFSLNYLKSKISDLGKLIFIDANLELKDIKTNFSNKIYTFNYFIEESTRDKQNFYNNKNILGYISEPITLNELDRFRHKKFLSFNRNVDKAHRFVLLDEFLKNTFEDSYFSFLRPIDYFQESKDFFKEYSGVILKDEDIGFYNQKLPIELDTHQYDDKCGFPTSNTFKKDLFLDSCIHLVTETTFIENELFISEKILKPLLSYQPFIIFGPYGYLKELKRYGFKTFSNFWDEGYDEIRNPAERMKSLISLVKELNSKSIEELNDIYSSTKETCIYNRNLFYSLELDSLKVIFEEIENEW